MVRTVRTVIMSNLALIYYFTAAFCHCANPLYELHARAHNAIIMNNALSHTEIEMEHAVSEHVLDSAYESQNSGIDFLKGGGGGI